MEGIGNALNNFATIAITKEKVKSNEVWFNGNNFTQYAEMRIWYKQIILLILVGITINSLMGSGLFEKAKEAKEEYSKAGAKEKVQMEVLMICKIIYQKNIFI